MAMTHRPLRRRSISASLTIALEDQVARPIPAKRGSRAVEYGIGSKGKRMAGAVAVAAPWAKDSSMQLAR